MKFFRSIKTNINHGVMAYSKALIAIAHPDFRGQLRDEARRMKLL